MGLVERLVAVMVELRALVGVRVGVLHSPTSQGRRRLDGLFDEGPWFKSFGMPFFGSKGYCVSGGDGVYVQCKF